MPSTFHEGRSFHILLTHPRYSAVGHRIWHPVTESNGDHLGGMRALVGLAAVLVATDARCLPVRPDHTVH